MSSPAQASRPAGAREPSYLALTFALMGGAVAWLLRLVVNSALVNYSCDIGSTWPLWLTTAVSTVVGGAALVVAWRLWRLPDDGARPADTTRWLGLLGIGFNITSIAGILLESAPIAVLDVCRSVVGA